MKAVILAGGLGTRISEETQNKPKPMVEIGGRPILWHIMKHYSYYDVNEFVICCGYKGYLIKEYFANYFLHMSDITFDMSSNNMEIHQQKVEPWKVTLVDTGENTQTGGRLKRIKEYIKDEKDFCLTYGDGLSDVNISSLIKYHREHGKLSTVTAVSPPGKYGSLIFDKGNITNFTEKPESSKNLINGGFFVLSPQCLDLIDGDDTPWEHSPMTKLVEMKQIMAYEHKGFWQPMDTLREKQILETYWQSGEAPWKKFN